MTNILKKRKQKGGQKKELSFNIDCSAPLEDNIFTAKEFVDYLKTNIKVNGKKGNLGDDNVKVTEANNVINVKA